MHVWFVYGVVKFKAILDWQNHWINESFNEGSFSGVAWLTCQGVPVEAIGDALLEPFGFVAVVLLAHFGVAEGVGLGEVDKDVIVGGDTGAPLKLSSLF